MVQVRGNIPYFSIFFHLLDTKCNFLIKKYFVHVIFSILPKFPPPPTPLELLILPPFFEITASNAFFFAREQK